MLLDQNAQATAPLPADQEIALQPGWVRGKVSE